MKNYKLLSAALIVGGLLMLMSSQAAAQAMKIGFVRDEKIKESYKPWQRAQEQWELERKAWDDEAAAKETELRDLMDEYDKQKLILSEDKRKEKEAAIRVKQEALDAYTRQIYGPGGSAERTQEKLIVPLLENVTKAIELVAVEGNFDVIFTMNSGLGYIRETFDVTELVVQKLETLEE
jgi:outer membrane protein